MAKLLNEEKISTAILNNVALYESVLRCGKTVSDLKDDIWYCLKETPPFYSNLITRSPTWQPDERFSEINRNYERENWSKLSVKDSFARLDLTSFGFKRLFDANWIYLPAEEFRSVKNSRSIDLEIVRDEDALDAWRRGWNKDAALGQKIFCNDMLQDPKISFVAGYDKDRIACGCLVNRSDEVLGISNFFAPGEGIDHWSHIIKFVFDAFSRADIVGYEQPEVMTKLRDLGVEPVGKLSVWLKKNVKLRSFQKTRGMP